MRIAILALQGAFEEHQKMLASLGVESFLIRKLSDWQQPKDGLILPGGESTAMLRIMNDEGLLEPIQKEINDGLAVFGTCAGMILLAKEVENDSRNRLATMDITVLRNAYGRQLGSFFVNENFKGIGEVPMTFIRAPYITKAKENVEILSSHDGHIIAARQGKQLAISFHPELNEDRRIHEYFIKMVKGE